LRVTSRGLGDVYKRQVPYLVTDHAIAVYRAMQTAALDGDKRITPINLVWALLHDAHEAYTSDLPAPLKAYLKQYTNALTDLESQLDRAIARHFCIIGIVFDPELIREFDIKAREQEYAYLFDGQPNLLLRHLGDRSLQETRANTFKNLVIQELKNVDAWRDKPQIKYTAKQAETPATPQPPRSSEQQLMDSLSAYLKDYPNLKVTLTIQ
jgi:5'-deoxynucleotidase YfbR-like HD superfamily hydrolase